jgi:hypothetical protein
MMPSLRRYLADGRLRRLPTSAREIADLLRVVDRDVTDASVESVSDDRRFATAYNAALQLCTVVLRAEGFRTAGTAHHHTTIVCLPEILGEALRTTSDYLDACRAKRNTVDYDGIGIATAADVEELMTELESLREYVEAWLVSTHPELRAI